MSVTTVNVTVLAQLQVDADCLARVRAIVAEQAEDEALWFVAETGPEAYLQAALRRLHAAIEADQ